MLVRAHCVLLTHTSDGVRLRVVSYTAQCVRVVCSVSVVSVYPFLRLGHCTRSHRTGLCQHAFPKGETSVHCTPDVWDTHSPNLCAQYPDPEPLALPWPAWELRQRQQGVSILASQTSWAKGFWLFFVQHQCPWWPSPPLAGCIPPKRVTLKSPSASRPPCTETSPIEDSDESVIQPYGWKAHVSSSRTDGSVSGWKSIPVD